MTVDCNKVRFTVHAAQTGGSTTTASYVAAVQIMFNDLQIIRIGTIVAVNDSFRPARGP